MSASREKKSRQADPSLGEKRRIVQEKEAAAKRKTRLYAAAGAVVAVAAAALLVWDSGILQRNAVGATINGEKYTAAEVDFYYNMTKNQFINMAELYAQYGMDVGYDTSKTPAEQVFSTNEETGETTTYEDYFRDSAMESMRQVVALNAAAAAEGYTLSDEGKATVESQNKQIDQAAAQYSTTRSAILKSNYGSNITDKIFQKHVEMSVLASEFQAKYQDSVEISDEAIDAYYAENKDSLDSFDYNYAFISGTAASTTDEDGNTVAATDEEKAAAMAAAKAKADALIAAVQAGEDFDAIAKDYVSEASKEYYEEAGYTVREGTLGSSLSTLYSDWMKDADRTSGDIASFESEGSGYAVIRFNDRYLSDAATVDVRHILIAPESEDEDAEEYTDEQWAAAESEAKELLTQFTVGADTSAEAFGKLADEYSDDARNDDGDLTAPGGLYTNVGEGQMVEEFEAWIMDPARTAGETGLVKTSFGWHIMYFVGRNEVVWRDTAKTALVNEAVTAWTEQVLETYGTVA